MRKPRFYLLVAVVFCAVAPGILLRGALTISGTVAISGAMQLSGNALTVPSQVINVSPANGATHVSYLPTISWQNGGGALTYQVFFDTSNPPTTSVQNSGNTSYAPSALSFSTPYYLKINSINNSGTTTGSVYSFTTEPSFAVNGYYSFNVGGSDGDTLTVAKLNTGTEVSLGTWTIGTINAISLISGDTYQIATVGTTDFTLLGAANNNVGTQFTANGTGTGTGSGTCTVPRSFVGANALAAYSVFTNSGNNYTGAGSTTSIKFGMDARGAYVVDTLTTPVNAFTAGFWVTVGPLDQVNPDAQDLWEGVNNSGGFAILSMKLTSGHPTFRMHTDALSGAEITIAANTTYWCTFDCSQHGTGGATDTLKVYDTSGNLVGTSTSDVSATGTGQWTKIYLGRVDAHHAGNNPPSTSYVNFSQMVANTSTLTYPLGP